MRVRVQKRGNSLAVRIPKPLAESTNIKEGTVLNLAVSDGKVVATPYCKKETIAEANARQGDSEKLHPEVDSGPSVGPVRDE